MKKLILLFLLFCSPAYAVVDNQCHVIDSTSKAVACNIYYESRSEPITGQIAVGWVVVNRIKSPLFPKTPSAVVKQKGQFRWYQPGRLYVAKEREAWGLAVNLAHAIVAGQVKDPTGGALFFDQNCPNKNDLYTKFIGRHCFRDHY